MTLFLIAVGAALFISALCSLLEATLLSLTPSQVATMGEKHPRVAVIWHDFKSNIDKPIAVILIVNTAAHTIGASVAGAEFEQLWGERWLFVFSLVLTYLMLQFTEILPKTLGVAYNAGLALVVARPLAALVLALGPVLWFIRLVNRPFERRAKADASQAMEEIRALAMIARSAQAIDTQQARLIEAASRLPEMKARQIMTPRVDVVYLTTDQPLTEVLRTVQKSPYTRLPLCEGDIDNIIGMVHVRDLFNHLRLIAGRLRFTDETTDEGEAIAIPDDLPGSSVHVIGSGDISLRDIMRQVFFVPDSMPLPVLLRRFQELRIHLAIVVDEYGAPQGIVTLEDVIEEMVGEIRDEFDVAEEPALTRVGNVIRASGSTPLLELEAELHLDIDADDVDTLGGLVLARLGRLPQVGDTVRLGHYEARVVTVSRRRVGSVELRSASP